MPNAKPQQKTSNETINSDSSRQKTINEAINEAIKLHPGINKPTLIQQIKRSKATIERAIAVLIRANKIEPRGSKRTGGYYLVEK